MILSSAPIIDIGYHEKRKHERRVVSWTVKGQFAGKKPFSSRTINVSESGMLLHMNREIPASTRAYIVLNAFISGKRYAVDGVIEFKHCVISNNQFHCGVQFIKISDKNRAILKAFATNRASSMFSSEDKEDISGVLGDLSAGNGDELTDAELDSSIQAVDINKG